MTATDKPTGARSAKSKFEKPILFSAPMIRSLLAGTKSQTRRVIKPQPEETIQGKAYWHIGGFRLDPELVSNQLPRPFQPGMQLWVRETYCVGWPTGVPHRWSALRASDCPETERRAFYKADGEDPPEEPQRYWKPSIFMPRWASRITLEVTDVRAEKLQDISEEDARAEGASLESENAPWITGGKFTSRRAAFFDLWYEINGKKYPWSSNPWTWVISFRVARAEGGRP